MGLDQYAFTKPAEGDEPEVAFVWRKHAQLQTFMEDLFVERTKQDTLAFNCVDFPLEEADLSNLEQALTQTGLPHSEGGFFFGHQFQDESAAAYKEQDLAFCAWAKAQIAAGETVIYHCWW